MKLQNPILLIVLMLTINISAQKPDISEPILKSSDVENFIKNYKKIVVDFKKLEVNFTPESDVQATLASLRNLEEANDIVKKYGFSDMTDFSRKIWAITASYTAIKMASDQTPEITQLLKSIDDNPNLTAEQKKAAKEQMMQAMQGVQKAFNSSANKKDIETVRPFVSKIENILEEE